MKKKIPLLIFIFFILASFLRLYKLGTQPLWVDEGFSWYTANFYSASEIYINRIRAGHFPFYFLFLKLWINIFGDSEFSLRMPSFLCSIFTMLLFYKLCKHTLGSKTSRILAFLMFGFSTFNIEIAQEARMYAPGMLLFLFWIDSLIFTIEFKKLTIKYIIATILFLAIGSISFLPFLSINLYLLTKIREKNSRSILYVNIAALIPFAMLIVSLCKNSLFIEIALKHLKFNYSIYNQFILSLGWTLRFFKDLSGFSWVDFNSVSRSILSLYNFIFVVFFICVICGLLDLKTKQKNLFLFLTIISFLPFFISFKFESRYLFYLLPILSIGLARLVSNFYEKNKKYTYILYILLCSIYMIDITNYFDTVKSPWRDVAQNIGSREKKNEAIFIFPGFCKPVFAYYYKGNNTIISLKPEKIPPYIDNEGVWYLIWSNIKLPWLGGIEAEKFDNYLKFYLSSHMKSEMIEYYKSRKGTVELTHYESGK